MHKRFLAALAVLIALALVTLVTAPPSALRLDPETARRLQELRNLGKAFYENPGTQTQAAEVLREAIALNPDSAREHLNYGLALLRAGQTEEGIAEIERAREIDPTLPHTYFNLGIEYKKRNEVERAIEELEQMAKLVPGEAKTHYNLGVLYKLKDDIDRAIAEFEKTIELNPSLAAPHFQLYNTLRRVDMDRAKRHLARFQEVKQLTEDAAVGEDINWSFYSELYDPPAPGPPADEAAQVEFRAEQTGGSLQGQPLGALVCSLDGDSKPDLVAWSGNTLMLYRVDGTGGAMSGRRIRHVAAGDANNDGISDLAVVRPAGVEFSALQLRGDLISSEPVLLAEGDFNAALWVDYDHDYDLDLLAVGKQQVLLRNNGDGTFADVSQSFPFVEGSEALAATWLELQENNSFNIVVAYTDELVVYKDRKVGQFRAHPIQGITAGSGAVRLDVVDADHDGFLDVAMTTAARTRLLHNQEGELRPGPRMPAVLAWADFHNRGWVDALTADRVLLNQQRLEFEGGDSAGLPSPLAAAAAADFNSDGKTDVAALDGSGKLVLLHNETATENNFVNIALKGVKNNVLSEGARVEVKAGRVYRKQVYAGVPLSFGLGAEESIDTVRITWPNGLIQNESEQQANRTHTYEEKPRLSGSCPMIYTWNGEEFEFISEVLGVAPLGAGLGGGRFFPVDHDEYVWISGERLAPRDGVYEVRITEELREVAYLDQIKLIAVDHPAGIDVFTSEKFKGPPFPEFRIYEVNERVYPVRATDGHGHDVREQVVRRDRRYVDDFQRDFANRAESHSLTLEFGATPENAVLYLHGWVDWTDASRIVAGSQSEENNLRLPSLQVKDRDGRWVTVIEDMGLPAGGPRTIAVELEGKFLSESREVRITTNLCVYWDEVFLAPDKAPSATKLTKLLPRHARLDFRGFSQVIVHPERKQPERFVYAKVSPTTLWNPTPGNYTRYGGVRELLTAIDDRFVILGAGDELTLRFPAGEFPALPEGWRRDFLLFVDGWAKENEANTAFGDSVEPLPFHAMSGYPYGPNERYPDTAQHRAYLRKYNVRPALRLIRPLR